MLGHPRNEQVRLVHLGPVRSNLRGLGWSGSVRFSRKRTNGPRPTAEPDTFWLHLRSKALRPLLPKREQRPRLSSRRIFRKAGRSSGSAMAQPSTSRGPVFVSTLSASTLYARRAASPSWPRRPRATGAARSSRADASGTTVRAYGWTTTSRLSPSQKCPGGPNQPRGARIAPAKPVIRPRSL
jgi:hypothetical protein